MSKNKGLIERIKEHSGTLSGAAQDTVELKLARAIREDERRLGQPVNTFDIPKLVAAENQRHGFVADEDVPKLAANVESAYGYVTTQAPLPISRAGYWSYQADEMKSAVGEVVKEVGAMLGGSTSTPKTE